jgi:malate dehydrogenase
MAMTALDANRAKAQVAKKCDVSISDIKKMTIWGNHSPTMYPDLDNAEINNKSVSSLINNSAWIENDFLQNVQQRGKAIIDARGASSATSAANAAIDTVKATLTETPEKDWFSAAIMSDGSYNVPEGLIFGFPLRSNSNGEVSIVKNLPISDYAQEKIDITTKELLEEKNDIGDLL